MNEWGGQLVFPSTFGHIGMVANVVTVVTPPWLAGVSRLYVLLIVSTVGAVAMDW